MEYLITEDELNKVWGNANFGKQDSYQEKIDIICKAIEKIIQGYEDGSFITAICKELNLICGSHLTNKGLMLLKSNMIKEALCVIENDLEIQRKIRLNKDPLIKGLVRSKFLIEELLENKDIEGIDLTLLPRKGFINI